MDDLIYRQDVLNLIPQDISDFDEGSCLAYDVGRLPSAQKWISCEKELPEVEQPVRISVHGRVFDAVYKGLSSDQEPMWLSHGCVYWAEEVSRWMPEPNKEETNG